MPVHDYSAAVLDHYENPRNVGEAERANAEAAVESDDCRDRLRLSLRVGPDGRIEQARFRTFGCVAAIAASSMTTEMLQGRSLDQARSITDEDVARALGGLPATKVHCSILAERAIRAAIEDFEARHTGA